VTDWCETTIAEVAAPHPHALATGPFGSAISSKNFVNDGVPVIRGSNLSLDVAIRLNDAGLAFLLPEKAATFGRSIARRGDLIFTCWGTVGQIGLIDDRANFDEYVVSNKQMKLTPDPSKVDSHFLYYLLSSPLMVDQVQGQQIGVAVPGFNPGQLREIRIRVPDVGAQRAIASVLMSLDDLVENNRRRIELLEQMTQAIFREWFVQFRFPGHQNTGLVDHPLGRLPEGWQASTWGELATLDYGRALRSFRDTRAGYPVFGTNGPIGWHSAPLFPPGVIVGRKGAYRGIHFTDQPCWVIDTAFYLNIADPSRVSSLFAYHQLRTVDLNSIDSGSAIPSTSRDAFYAIPIVLPPSALVRQFTDVAQVIFEVRRAIEESSGRLSSVRDLLLPKLVTGEIDVSNLALDPLETSVA
jgi:type I restriction enzyme, S subunit